MGCPQAILVLPRKGGRFAGRATGSVAPGKIGGRRRRLLEPHRDFIIERINQTPYLTLHRLNDELAGRGVVVSHNTVSEFLRREGLSFKKNAVRS